MKLVAKVVTMGWKRSTATQKPLSAPARMPAPRPAPADSGRRRLLAMRVTMITLAIETIAPKESRCRPRSRRPSAHGHEHERHEEQQIPAQ